jgi:hypothetical protein
VKGFVTLMSVIRDEGSPNRRLKNFEKRASAVP